MSTGQAYHPRGNNHYPRSWGIAAGLSAGAALFPRGQTGTPPPAVLVAWWDASQIAGIGDGDAVASWADLSGNGNHAAQVSTPDRPTYHTAQLNGLPVVRFGSGQWMDLTMGIDLTAAGTVLGVVKHTGHCVIMGQAVGSGGPYICSHELAHALDGNRALYAVPMTSHTLFAVTYDGASFVFRVSGSPVSAHSTGSCIMTDDLTTLAKTPSWIGNCEIAELLVYDSVLSAADISQIEAYLNAKWLASASVYTVAGAGDSSYNGGYYDTGQTRNGQPVWTNGTRYLGYGLHVDSNWYWMLTPSMPLEVISMTEYTPNAYLSSGVSPDDGAWAVGSLGTAPAPTVTAA